MFMPYDMIVIFDIFFLRRLKIYMFLRKYKIYSYFPNW